MDKTRLKEAFKNYVSAYDLSDPKIELKAVHTYKVATFAEEIGRSIPDLREEEVDFCWLLGLLHDIGRFEQLKRYGTFLDAESVDHAELGADILFKEGVLSQFWTKGITGMPDEEEKTLIELAIRQHNKLALQEGLSEKEAFYCNVLRDADKVDIFRVAQEVPFEVRMTSKRNDVPRPAREEIMECIRGHRCVPKLPNRTEFESHLCGLAMAFELVFEKRRLLAKEQGFLGQMLSYEPADSRQKKQMEEVRKELDL